MTPTNDTSANDTTNGLGGETVSSPDALSQVDGSSTVQLGDVLGERPLTSEPGFGVIEQASRALASADVHPTVMVDLEAELTDSHNYTRTAIRLDALTSGDRGIVSWRTVLPPRTWQLDERSVPGAARSLSPVDGRVTITQEHQTGIWVEVTVDSAAEEELSGWIERVPTLSSVSTMKAPIGYLELPRWTEIDVTYPFDTNDGPALVVVRTLNTKFPLNESDGQLFLSTFGPLGPRVVDPERSGALYPYLQPPDGAEANGTSTDAGPSTDTALTTPDSAPLRYGWQVDPSQFVLLEVAGSVTPDEVEVIAHNLALSTDLSDTDDSSFLNQQPVQYGFGGTAIEFDGLGVSAATEVADVRSGRLTGGPRLDYFEATPLPFVYIESAFDGTDDRCAVLLVGGDMAPHECARTGRVPGEPLCAYRVDELPGAGFELTVVADAEVADQIVIRGVEDLTRNDLGGDRGTTDSRRWTVMRVPSPVRPSVDGSDDGLTCYELG